MTDSNLVDVETTPITYSDGLKVPGPRVLKEQLGMLLGRDVAMRRVANFEPSKNSPAFVALFVNGDRVIRGTIVLGIPLGIRLAGALVMLSPREIDAQLKAGTLNGEDRDNLAEVCNVLASLFERARRERVVFGQLYDVPGAPPLVSTILETRAGARFDVFVELKNFGSGLASVRFW